MKTWKRLTTNYEKRQRSCSVFEKESKCAKELQKSSEEDYFKKTGNVGERKIRVEVIQGKENPKVPPGIEPQSLV